MTDVHTIKIRSKNMQAIKSKDTNIEITVRKLIRKLGYSLLVIKECEVRKNKFKKKIKPFF